MLGSIGMPEMIIILVIALIIFGPRKLPELGRSLGKSLAEFKRASNELRATLEEEIRIEDQKTKTEATESTKAADAPAAQTEGRLDGLATHLDEPVGAGTSGEVDKSA